MGINKIKDVHDKLGYYSTIRINLESLIRELEIKSRYAISTLNSKEKDDLLFFDTNKLDPVPRLNYNLIDTADNCHSNKNEDEETDIIMNKIIEIRKLFKEI